MTSGQIEFDHGSTKCSRVNTCTPSIQFSNIDKIQNYEKFEDLMMNFVVGRMDLGVYRSMSHEQQIVFDVPGIKLKSILQICLHCRGNLF